MFVVLFVSLLVFLIVVPIGILITAHQEAKEQKKCNHKWVLWEATVVPSYWYCSDCRVKHEKPEE